MYMVDQEQLRALDSTIEDVYLGHMGKELSFQPIDPVSLLMSTSGTEGGDYYVDTAEAIRNSFNAHRQRMEEMDLDFQPALSASYLVNMLTEVNLPHYTETIGKAAGDDGIFRTWLNEWTAEEHPHEVIMRDYALMSGLMGNPDAVIPHVRYAQGAASQHRAGTEITIRSLSQGFAYLTLQEDATYEAHNVEGDLLDPFGRTIHRRIAGNESKHHRVYGKLAKKMLDLYPEETVVAIRDVYRDFDMPGEMGIPNFRKLSLIIAKSGIFGPQTILDMQKKHVEKIYDLENQDFSSDEAKIAQAELIEGLDIWKLKTEKISAHQDKAIEKAKKSGKVLPFVIGKTVAVEDKTLVPKAA